MLLLSPINISLQYDSMPAQRYQMGIHFCPIVEIQNPAAHDTTCRGTLQYLKCAAGYDLFRISYYSIAVKKSKRSFLKNFFLI